MCTIITCILTNPTGTERGVGGGTVASAVVVKLY